MMLDQMSEQAKRVTDVAAIAIPVAAWVNYLPSVAAGLSIIWLALRIAIAIHEYRTIRRKDAAQSASVKSLRQLWNETTKEPMPPKFKKLLDDLK